MCESHCRNAGSYLTLTLTVIDFVSQAHAPRHMDCGGAHPLRGPEPASPEIKQAHASDARVSYPNLPSGAAGRDSTTATGQRSREPGGTSWPCACSSPVEPG